MTGMTGNTDTSGVASESSVTGEGSATTGAPTTGTASAGMTEATGSATGSDTGTTGEDACASSVLTWENFGEPFMLGWCTGCHHSALPVDQRACAPCSVNFDQHAGAYIQAPNIALRVLDWAEHEKVTPMPPAAIVPDDQRALLREYLDCGAPGPEMGQAAPVCPDPGTKPDCP